MKKTLRFDVTIQAPRSAVFATLQDAEGYMAWTAAFCEGSYFAGSWEQGAKIHFLAPSGDGVAAEIAENRPDEYIAIRHLGEVSNGVEDTRSDKVRAWAPAYETYAFADAPGGCTLTVTLDTLPEYEDYMRKTFPEALSLLKALCEQAAR